MDMREGHTWTSWGDAEGLQDRAEQVQDPRRRQRVYAVARRTPESALTLASRGATGTREFFSLL